MHTYVRKNSYRPYGHFKNISADDRDNTYLLIKCGKIFAGLFHFQVLSNVENATQLIIL